MQLANIMLALGGDINNTVPKREITAAEIGTLMAIHGRDSVLEVEPAGEVKVTNRNERERLRGLYGQAQDGEGNLIFNNLFPGAAARVYEALDELELDDSQYKPVARTTARGGVKSEDAVREPNEDDLDEAFDDADEDSDIDEDEGFEDEDAEEEPVTQAKRLTTRSATNPANTRKKAAAKSKAKTGQRRNPLA